MSAAMGAPLRGIGTAVGIGMLPDVSEIEITVPSDSPANSAYCLARFSASVNARARASLINAESSSME